MLLKNIGSKIVNVGDVILMPDDEKTFPDAKLDTPAVKALVKHGFLQIAEEPAIPKAEEAEKEEVKPEEVKVEEAEPEVAATAEEPAEKKTAKRARGSKTKE